MNWDRVKESFASLVGAVMSRVDFLALYPCQVIAQNADGTLELKPENENLPGFSRVPIRHTIPGLRVELAGGNFSGCRALVGFDGGDPTKPFVANFFGPDFTTLLLGSTATVDQAAYQYVALATKVLNELNKIKTAFDSHTHTVSVATTCPAGAGSGTGTGAAPTPIPAISSVASTRVKTH